jgi:hypothetical protein
MPGLLLPRSVNNAFIIHEEIIQTPRWKNLDGARDLAANVSEAHVDKCRGPQKYTDTQHSAAIFFDCPASS